MPLLSDLRFIFRNLARNPSFVAAAVISLALGIGANTAIFTLTNQILLRMLPVRDPGRLVALHWNGQFIGGTTRGWTDTFAYPTYADLRGETTLVDGIAARYQDTVDVSDRGPAQRATAELVSGNYFEVTGATTAIGRTLTPEDDKLRGGEPYVVLSYDYWQRRFGGDPSALNRKIAINGFPMTIVGVAQRGFAGINLLSPADLFIPMAMKTAVTPTWDDMDRRDSIWLKLVARLKPGVDPKSAQAALNVAYHRALENDLSANPRNRAFAAKYLRNTIQLVPASKGIGDLQEFFSKPLYVLLGMVGLLLAIACLNVANLLITRAATRQREIAIRLSLGATRASLVRLILMESLVIAIASGVLGILLALWVSPALVRMLPYDNIDVAIRTSPDFRVLAFTTCLSVLTAILFGLAPAWQATRTDLEPALKSASRSASGSMNDARFRRALISAQVALSFLLLVGAGLFARSLYSVLTTDSGMKTSNLLTFSLDPSLHKYSPERSRRFFLQLQDALRRAPGVVSVSGASFAVLADNYWQNTVHIEGYRPGPNEDMNPGWNQMLPGFFAATGVPLIAGRDFSESDTAGAPKVVIVNETFQKRFFPHGSPVGYHLGMGDTGPTELEIIGVVKDSKVGNLKDSSRPWTFTPALQDEHPSAITFYLRTIGDPLAAAQAVRRIANGLDSTLPVFDLKTVRRQIDETHFLDRLFAWLSLAFGLLATLIASVGLYGITAFSVARRTQEIGIRMALGAERGDVLRLILRETILLTAIGLAIGVPTALALGRFVQSQLFGIKANDPGVIACVVAIVAAVSMFAAYLPARRAAWIEPLRALHYD